MAKHMANIGIHIVTYSLVGNLLEHMSIISPIKGSPHIWLANCWHACLMLGQLNVLYSMVDNMLALNISGFAHDIGTTLYQLLDMALAR